MVRRGRGVRWPCGAGAVNNRGVVYVAYGDQARVQAALSARTLVERNPGLPFRVITDERFVKQARFPEMLTIYHEDTDPGARGVKLNVDLLSPFDHTLYLDADTRVMQDITMPFDLLDRGWEMCIAPCRQQEPDEVHGHINAEERAATFEEIGFDILALQAGVIYFRKCDAVHHLFAEWREEWARWHDMDQAALMRAIVRCPVKLFPLNRSYNGGRVIQHFYTYARREGLKYSRRT